MDLSKAFNTPNLSLPLVKLNAYGFPAIRDKSCSKLFLGTISKVNIKNNFSECCLILPSDTRVNSRSPFIQYFH